MTKQTTRAPVMEVLIGAAPRSREEAIRMAADLLVSKGCVPPEFAESMLRREQTADTFLGFGVAIPHGTLEDKSMVRRDGIGVVQIPAGLDWGQGRTVHLVVGIAAASDGHIAILRRLAGLIQDAERVRDMGTTTDPEVIRDALMREESASTGTGAQDAGDLEHVLEWTLDYPSGLHARPAMVWVAAAKEAGVPLRVRHAGRAAAPRNLVALLQLGLKQGDTLRLSADGETGRTALYAFLGVLRSLSAGEKEAAHRAAQQSTAVAGWMPPGFEQGKSDRQGMSFVQGVSAGSGLAVGRVFRLDAPTLSVPDTPMRLAQGGALLEDALRKTRQQMKALEDDTTRRLGAQEAAIFQAQAALMDDADLLAAVSRYMVAGHGPAWSWHAAMEDAAGQMASLGNTVLAGRAADLRDIGRRVLLNLDPSQGTLATHVMPEGPVVIIAGDLSPSDTAGLDAATTAGFVTALGGPTSHTAILARTLGLAAVVAAGDGVFAAQNNDTVIVDGDGGRLWLNPTQAALEAAKEHMEGLRKKREAEAAERGLPAWTRDGFRLEVAANINLPDQASVALELGAEGVGLMRTEFLFLGCDESPGEDEQYETYRAMLKALNGRPLIVRALDIGGDKPVAHLNLPHEENPFLGVRGSRLLLRRPDLLTPQLRALYRAAKEGGMLSIMFPMVTSVPEVLAIRAHCEAVRKDFSAPRVPLGIMIEVPAAAVTADKLAPYVDFFSVGTNDLAQYTLAMDRQNPVLAPETDGMHPAVLRLIHMTVQGTVGHDCWVGVCGGLAGDPLGAALLAGLGVTEFSMAPREIPAVKAMIRSHNKKRFIAMAEKALTMENPAQVRSLAAELKEEV